MIKVLVVEDSAVVRAFLVEILGSDPDMEVVGTASDGEDALAAVERLRPDVITMDMHMPKLDGLEATRRIMETTPTPIVIVSGSTDPHEVATTFRAMEAGALAILRRPAGLGHPDHEATAGELLRTVKLMSEVKVVRRWPRLPSEDSVRRPSIARRVAAPGKFRLVAIGASTGGPAVLQTILAGLPKSFPLPLLIVQHMTQGFTEGFVEWLAQSTPMSVGVARHGEPLLAGHVYVAPDGLHMKVGHDETIVLASDEPENGLRPSVSCLFRSVADVCGGKVVAGLLTGMGRDGARELKLLNEMGAVTIAQDRDSSVVHGMPGEAIRLDAATLVLSPEKIAAALMNLADNRGTLDWNGIGNEAKRRDP
ncbi:MAG: chemotaxis-specific protein-glutamate methyltransferase CheB [Acidobacteria bacterium]|nr:chemotaxis-specific protein-glutamate methyltransferase CheB [Acidobacteriota bacterium]